MIIRKTAPQELDAVMGMYAAARVFMAEHGNAGQWGKTYPEREMVEEDIRSGHSYVCEDEGRIAAVFFYSPEPDPCYRIIEKGQWLNDEPYSVVHRITSDGRTKGAATSCLAWALKQSGNVRIDTHRDNYVMQNMLEKNGFSYCGIVHMEDGTERMGYQKHLLGNVGKLLFN